MASVTLTAMGGEPVDALIWRELGLGPQALPAVFVINRGLAERVMPLAGEAIEIPATLIGAPQPALLDRPQLWD